MITSRFIFFFFGFMIINLMIYVLVNYGLRNKKIVAFLGCVISLMLIVSICFFPFPMQDELLEDMKRCNQSYSYNFIPFKTTITIIIEAVKYKTYGDIVYQIMGNIILFFPLGFSLFFLSEGGKRIVKGFVLALCTSVLVEVLQGFYGFIMPINYRAVDIDDVILNVLGGLLGVIVASYVHEQKERKFSSL